MMFDHPNQPDPIGPSVVAYEVHDEHALVAREHTITLAAGPLGRR